MKLIYINFLGTNFRGINIYEFLYTYGDTKVVDGEDWDACPANGNPMPPIDYVDAAYKLETELTFELIQNHESFNMYDCMHGVIALAWEDDIDFDLNSSDSRLFFSYGESKENVENKIYQRDLYLEKIFENEKEEHY